MPTPFPFRVAATLALALAAAVACSALGTPLPWMLGPLGATALASMLGAPTQSSTALRNGGQCLIGTALGLYFTAEVTALVLRLWWAILLAVAWALVLGWVFGCWLDRALRGRLPASEAERRATSYFAGAIGGASEMTLLAERAGGRTDLVAAAHSLRLLVVAMALPQPLVNVAQLVIGVSLGVRFRAEFVHTAPRWLAFVAIGTLGMIGLCALFTVALAWATGLHPVTLVLGTAPGGIAEMAITAEVLQLGVPVATAFQVCRLVAVLVLLEPLHRWGWLR